MRMLLMAALLAVVAPQAQTQNNAVIEGRALRPGSLDPIPNVQITLTAPPSAGTSPQSAQLDARILELTSTGTQAGVSQTVIDGAIANARATAGAAASPQNSTSTDSSGHFSFRNLGPGKYTLRATLDGYFGPSINGSASTTVTKSITIEAQKPVPAADFFMVKGGVISGRIRDPNGQPVSGVTVASTRVTYANGRPQWTTVSSKATDDRGEYRIFWMSPGEYNVGVTPRPLSAIPGPQDAWARTFFPGVSDPSIATAVTIKDGMELAGIDFTIQTIGSTGAFKITGKASNPLAVPNPTTGLIDRTVSSFILSPRDPGILDSINPPSVQNALPPANRQNGEFEIRNVRPGSYDLIAFYSSPLPPVAAPATGPVAIPFRRYYIDRAHVDVRNSDVEGITLEIQKGTEISGRIVNQGTSYAPLDKIRLTMHSQDSIPEAFATIVGIIPVDSSGVFNVTDIASAKYSFQVIGLPDSAYVAGIRQNGTDIFDSAVTVGDQPSTSIEILINTNGGTIDGNVLGPDHTPAVNVTVVLVPGASHRQNPMMYKTAITDETGHFSMKSIAPGDYNLFAWESVLPTAWMNSEFLSRYQTRGRPVVISQGVHLDTQLDLIPDDFDKH